MTAPTSNPDTADFQTYYVTKFAPHIISREFLTRVTAREAIAGAHRLIKGPSGPMMQRVYVVFAPDDTIAFDWESDKGITFPPPPARGVEDASTPGVPNGEE